jgi:amino acid transporter
MAERQLHGLQRVLGVNALFSTAYGNVGSSIYYALGLVAALAAGLTPLVFLITGALFYCTATTYAEATAMYPEAGGSSLFARRAFNELWSFFTAWAQMLNYIITIAISAFFAAHYAAPLIWQGFEQTPGDIAFAALLVALLALVNVRGVKDAVSVNLVLAVIDFLSQLAIVGLGVVLVFNPAILVDNLSFFGETPTLTQFLLAIPIGTVAYTGIETISNMAGEARDPDTSIPAAIRRVMIAVFAIYFTLPLIALSALPVECVGGECRTLLGLGPEENGYANNPIIGVISGMELGGFQGAVEFYVGVLAVTILIAATNAGVLGVSRLTYSMGMYRQLPDTMRRLHPHFRTPYLGILVFSGVAILALLPGQADFLGKIYAFGAMLSFSMAAPVSQPRAPARPRPRAAAAGRRRPDRHGPLVHRRQRARPDGRRRGGHVDGAGHGRLPALPPQPGVGLHLHAPGRGAAAGHRDGGRVRVGARRARCALLLADDDRHRDQARRTQTPRHPRARADHRPAGVAAGRRASRGRDRRTRRHRAGATAGRAAGERPRRASATRRQRPADRRRGTRDARARARHAAAAAHRHDAVRKDRRDRAGRPSLPRDHRKRADECLAPGPVAGCTAARRSCCPGPWS